MLNVDDIVTNHTLSGFQVYKLLIHLKQLHDEISISGILEGDCSDSPVAFDGVFELVKALNSMQGVKTTNDAINK